MSTSEILDSEMSRSDMAMVRRAIREKWDIRADIKSTLPMLVTQVALKAESESVRLGAMKLLMRMAESNDLQDHPPEQPQYISNHQTNHIEVNVTQENMEEVRAALAKRIARLA